MLVSPGNMTVLIRESTRSHGGAEETVQRSWSFLSVTQGCRAGAESSNCMVNQGSIYLNAKAHVGFREGHCREIQRSAGTHRQVDTVGTPWSAWHA